ncbi:MAG: endonuclease/exonuclease/phosphatase family protein [Patescibacteria group bacterium]
MNFSVLNWNIEGTKYYTSTSLNKITPSLEKSSADIFCLQEAQELREKLSNFNKLQQLNHIFPASEDNRNIILSKFPIISSGELAFPPLTNNPLEKVLWAEIAIETKTLKIYNCHFEIIGVGPQQRASQLAVVLADAKKHIGPVIICGDLNTTIPAAGWGRKFVQWFHKETDASLILDGQCSPLDERYPFVKIAERAGFREALDISQTTWCIKPFYLEIFNLKLDWFFVRDLKTPRISLGAYISDHRSILAEFSTPQN